MSGGKLAENERNALFDCEESLRVMSGRDGARVLGGLTVRTSLQITSIQIRETPTTFTTLTCTNGVDTPLTDTFFLGGASGFIAGDTLTPPYGYKFTVITLASGSVSVTGPNIGT